MSKIFHYLDSTLEPLPPTVKLSPLTTVGRQLKTVNGDDFRVKGLTAFPIIRDISAGRDISWIRKLYPSANVYRAFWYTPKEAWGDKYWELNTPDEIVKAHQVLADQGIYLYNTCLTDYASEDKIALVKAAINKLRDSQLPNVLFESKNEPYTHDNLDPGVLKNALSGSGYLYTSGVYDTLNGFWGKFGNNHCPRDAESVRKFADLEGLYNLIKVPWFEGEPFKLPGYPLMDFYTFAAGTSFMGNGGIYHCQSMEYLSQPNEDEIKAGQLFLKALDVFPFEAQLGKYAHRKDLEGIVNEGTLDEHPTTCLRCYQKGNYAIVVRKNDTFKVPSNWVSLDEFGVCYKVL